MKITRIKALCKEASCAIICSTPTRQYIGTLEAIYPASDVEIGKASIPTLFDMPDALDDLRVDERQLNDSDLMPVEGLRSYFASEGQLREAIGLNWLGEQVLGLASDDARTILFVRMDYIRAAEKTEGYAMYHLAHNAKGEPLIVLSDGLIMTGIVKPIPERTAQSILTLMRGLTGLTPCGSPDPGVQREEDGQLPGQMRMEDMMEEAGADADHNQSAG